MAYSEDHIALAAEYALGTLDADERTQVETMMAVDKEFAAIVQAWEFRLGVLNQMVGSVEPRRQRSWTRSWSEAWGKSLRQWQPRDSSRQLAERVTSQAAVRRFCTCQPRTSSKILSSV